MHSCVPARMRSFCCFEIMAICISKHTHPSVGLVAHVLVSVCLSVCLSVCCLSVCPAVCLPLQFFLTHAGNGETFSPPVLDKRMTPSCMSEFYEPLAIMFKA